MKKYVVIGGEIPSKNDNDIHYIHPTELIRLYRLDIKDCYIFNSYKEVRGLSGKYIFITPRYDGNYNLKK